MKQPHVLAAISSHGFGHIAQCAPVLNELLRRAPHIKLTVQCAAPRELLALHIHVPFEHWPQSTDLGVVNRGALAVLVDETATVYRQFHADYDARIIALGAAYRARGVTALFADVPYLPLAAAAHAGIPAIAMCSLNWADICAHYLDDRPESREWIAQMRNAYASARAFLQPDPSMPMPDLLNTRRIGPVARLGRERRAELCAALGVDPGQTLALISLGGIPTDLGINHWPRNATTTWLVQREWNITHPDARAWNATGIAFIDVLRSCDAFITKPGYGSFAESACNGVRVLYVPHPDWPEAHYLVGWLPQHVPCAAIAPEQFHRGEFHDTLQQLVAQPRPDSLPPDGIAAGAEAILDIL